MKTLKMNKKKEVFQIESIRKSPDKLRRKIPLDEHPGMGLIGLGHSGKRNLSDNHDKYLVRYARQKKK